MASNVPLTLQVTTSPQNGLSNLVVIGKNYLTVPGNLYNVYWALVIDRTNLNVVQNFTFSNNNTVPSQLTPYMNNPQYMLILTSQGLVTANIPAGNFYSFLQQLGSGPALQSIEQLFAALNCGYWVNLTYSMISVFDSSDAIEFSEYGGTTFVYTLQLVPVQVGTGVLYTPSKLS